MDKKIAIFFALFCVTALSHDNSYSVRSLQVFAENSHKSDFTVLAFEQIATDSDGKRYVIGEVNNPKNYEIQSIVYFSKSTLESAYHINNIGMINAGKGMPFKIPLQDKGLRLDPSDIKIASYRTIGSQNDNLLVDYNSIVMDRKTHSISGMLDNKSPNDSFGVKVFAIAMDTHSKILDVVESNMISSLPSNSSTPFSLTPMDSIANQVAYYSCFVPNQSGQNFTLPAENGQYLQLEIGSDGKIKNVKYDPSTHTINLDAQGIFPGGGWVEIMFISGPVSFTNSKLSVMLNGHNATKTAFSTAELAPGNFYKHVEVLYPFGKNSISITASSAVPELPFPAFVVVASFGIVVIISELLKRKRSKSIF